MSLTVSRSSGSLAADRRFAWGAAAAAEGDHAAAAGLFAQTLEIAPAFAAAAFAMGTARVALADRAGAGQAFELALALDPADEQGAALHLARLGLRETPQTAPQAWVRELFDAYAPGFDAHLSGALQYRAPKVLAELVGQVTQRRFGTALDLGCGTGLSGEAFRARCDHLSGVDLSPRMIECARRKNIYDRLVVVDIDAFLASHAPASASLILAADVFVYLGNLAPVLHHAAAVLEPQGLLAFTLQKGEQPFSLGEDLRYAHNLACITGLAHASGLTIQQSREVSTRQDKGADVPGFGIVLAKPA